MRIRSIKPEFWRSDNVDSLSWHTRLLFIGLWSYVDDNGVGRDRVSDIVADLFAGDLSGDPPETLRRVAEGLEALEDGGQIVRYIAEGRRLLFVTAWDRHQQISHPNKPRYPRPTSGDTPPSGDPPETLRKDSPTSLRAREGTGEQGNRGTAKAGAAPAAENSGTLIKEWIDNQPRRPPDQVVGQVAKNVGQLLNGDGYTPEQVRSGLLAWQSRGLHPNALPSIVHEITTPRSRPKPRNQVETETWLAEAWERAEAADLANERKELET